MAFDDVTLFELHFDGTTFGTPSVGEAIDAVGVTDPDRMVSDPDRMVTDPDRMAEDEDVELTDAENKDPSPARGRRLFGVVALVAAAVAARAVYRRRRGDGGAAVAVESVDKESADGEADPVEQ